MRDASAAARLRGHPMKMMWWRLEAEAGGEGERLCLRLSSCEEKEIRAPVACFLVVFVGGHLVAYASDTQRLT